MTGGFPKGIITVLNTPFDAAGGVDFSALQKHVEYAARSGVAGFLVPAMAAEVYSLTRAERKDMVRAVHEVCPPNITVIGGAGGKEAAQRKEFIEDLLEIGCRHILLQIPYTDEQSFRQDFSECHAMDMEAIMLQDWDSGGGGLPLELIDDLFQNSEKFQALKVETVPAGPKYSEVLDRTEGRLHVSGGWAVLQMIEAMDRGVHAFMPTAMHEVYVAIHARYQSGDRAGAYRLFLRLLPILAFSNQHLDVSIAFFKRMLHKLGIYPNASVRGAAAAFDSVATRYADELIEEYLRLREDLSAGRI